MTERYEFHFRHILKDGTEQDQQPALTIVR